MQNQTTNPGQEITLEVGKKVIIKGMPPNLYLCVAQENTFINPKYESNERQGYSNWETSHTIETYQATDGNLIVPRGYLPRLLELCDLNDITPKIIDQRVSCPTTFPELKGVTLRPYQQRAVGDAMTSNQGVIVSPTGSGKSLMGLEIIRRRGQKALIIVHRSDLAKQWIDVIAERMGIVAGFIGEGKWMIGESVTVAMIQTLSAQEEETRLLSDYFGLVLMDEVHHAPAETFTDVIGWLAAKYRYGLSATLNRRDGLEKMIYRAIGFVIATIKKEEVEGVGATVPVSVLSINTHFNPGGVDSWHEYLDAITESVPRNEFILNIANRDDNSILILTDRITHAETLSNMLTERGVAHVLAHGKLSKKERAEVMERFETEKITIGTTSLIGEGIDCSNWGALVMATPISSETKLMQAIGRIVRPRKGKTGARVYDLKDDCGFAGSSFKSRFEVYKKNKIWVKFENDNGNAGDRRYAPTAH